MEKSVPLAHFQEIVISHPLSIFFCEISYTSSHIVRLPETLRKIFLTEWIPYYDRICPNFQKEKLTKNDIFGHFSPKKPLQKFSAIVYLEYIFTHLLTQKILKKVYNWRKITTLKEKYSSFSDWPCSSSSKFFVAVFIFSNT